MKNNIMLTRPKRTLLKRIVRCIPLYVMMIPGLVYLFINNYIPMAGIVIAFKKMDFSLGKWAIFKSPWVGLKNFEYLFKTDAAWLMIKNTVGYNMIFIITGLLINIGVAILLNEIRSKTSKKIYQVVILIPVMLSIVIVSYLVFGFLSQESGFINKSILEPLGIEPIRWYSEPKYWHFILPFINNWKGFGYGSIIYYAVLVGVDKGLYEAAAIDGASRLKQILHISIPALKPTAIILTLLSIGKLFNSDFGLFYQVPRNYGPLFPATQTIDTYVYRALVTNNDVTMSSAANFYQAIVGFVLVLSFNLIVRKIDKESSLF
jgi:putative aldouronate transport system permease protein